MGHIKNYPFTFVGFILLIVGWFSIFTGILGFFRAEDLFIVTFKVEKMIFDTTYVPASHIALHMMLRIVLGLFIVFIGNSFLARGLMKHNYAHPRFGDFRRLS